MRLDQANAAMLSRRKLVKEACDGRKGALASVYSLRLRKETAARSEVRLEPASELNRLF